MPIHWIKQVFRKQRPTTDRADQWRRLSRGDMSVWRDEAFQARVVADMQNAWRDPMVRSEIAAGQQAARPLRDQP